jgi:hypothetical protein
MSRETSDGIAPHHWDLVHEAAIELANADDDEIDAAQRTMMRVLDELQELYGKRPSLLATRADYVDDDRRERLYLEAFELASERGDEANLLFVSHSLAELYIETLRDVQNGRRWLEEYRRRREQTGGLSDATHDATLTKALMALDVSRAANWPGDR